MVEKIIHQITGPNTTELTERCLKSWSALTNKGFGIVTWTDDTINGFIDEHYEFAMPAIESARNHAEASDIARYLIVYHFGGYYVDWDIHLNDDNLFIKLHNDCSKGCLVVDPINQTLASEFFSAMTQERFLLELAKDIIETFNRDERDLMNTPQYSGPYRMRASLRRHPITSQDIVPVKEIFEYDYSEIRNASNFEVKGIMTHYWAHSWL